MNNKTVWTKDNTNVTLVECHKYIDGKLKNYHIEGTDKYFVRYGQGAMAAQELLLKLTISAKAFAERKDAQARLRHAKKIVHLNNCLVETDRFIKRWDGVLYLETKKELLAEIQVKLDTACSRYGFKTPHEAIGVVGRDSKLQRKRL